MSRLAVIVSTYRNPQYLDLCLAALQYQAYRKFEILVADDGSGDKTRAVIESHQARSEICIRHVWQADRGFRKTRILNKAIKATDADYLVFIDGDCLAHPQFVAEHIRASKKGHYVNGSLIRLNARLSAKVSESSIQSGKVWDSRWLGREGRRYDRRFLRLSLPYRLRCWMNRHSRTTLYWLGSNSSCFRSDAEIVNGFDNRFTYGFEDGDFGKRLENFGVLPVTARWTAVLLHLDHGKPWADPQEMERNRQMMTVIEPGGRYWAEDGLEQVSPAEDYGVIIPSES